MKLFRAAHFAAIWSWLIFGASMASPAQTNSHAAGALPSLAPAYPEMAQTFWELHHAAVIGCGLVLALLLALLVWSLLKPKPAVVVPPGAVARQALLALVGQPEDGACLTRVSQILRHYFIVAFEIPAGELTTAEFYSAISNHQKIGEDLAGQVSEFLRQCDARKFGISPEAAPLNAVAHALELVTLADTQQAQWQTTAFPQP